jgi:pyruvate/2-oxoglutarate dehydrogenase complex dihydrolipoamide acyltransferase (E2) component
MGAAVRRGAHRAVATSPAVGVFQPRVEISSGTRVRAGDRLAFVDMLGIPQDVVSPVDGIVGASLVEPGEAVEYGQELIRIELAAQPAREREGRPAATASGAGGSSGRAIGGVSGVPGVDPIEGGHADEPDALATPSQAGPGDGAPEPGAADVGRDPTPEAIAAGRSSMAAGRS